MNEIIDMAGKYKTNLLGLMLLSIASLSVAKERGCDHAVSPKLSDESGVSLFVYEVAPKAFDLAMRVSDQADEIKRVTHNADTSGCGIQPIALERGGDWGWHLVWVETGAGVFYARMDGEAWVSSPRKKLAEMPVTQIELKLVDQAVELHWLDAAGKQASRKSEDEGRYWD